MNSLSQQTLEEEYDFAKSLSTSNYLKKCNREKKTIKNVSGEVRTSENTAASLPPLPVETSKDFSSQRGKFGSRLKWYGWTRLLYHHIVILMKHTQRNAGLKAASHWSCWQIMFERHGAPTQHPVILNIFLMSGVYFLYSLMADTIGTYTSLCKHYMHILYVYLHIQILDTCTSWIYWIHKSWISSICISMWIHIYHLY